MKRIFSFFMALILVYVMCYSVSAQGVIEEIFPISVEMTEQEFRTYSEDAEVFSSSSSNEPFDGSIHKNGYYYTRLREKFGDSEAVQIYDLALKGFSKKDRVWSVTLYTDLFNGLSVSDSLVGEIWNIVSNRAIYGMWSYRYDNPLIGDIFTSSVAAGLSYTYTEPTGEIISASITVSVEAHPYFTESYITARDEKIKEIAKNADAKKSQYEALKYIHDTIAQMGEYDNEVIKDNSDTAKLSEDFFLAHSAFGILAGKKTTENGEAVINRKGVCESYAKAFMEICNSMKNPPFVTVLTSYTHMWNLVKLANKWYCVDVTWDDQGDYILNTYFLCGDPDVVDGVNITDHIPDERFTLAPEYSEEKYVYKETQGDLNGDCVADIMDFIRLKKLLASGVTENLGTGDLDDNYYIDAKDLTGLKKILIGVK